ncbi:MAG: trimethylamine methyltransferase [Desulfobulbaceae bacterium]|nr:trimethylamine methyltransferase [Desulfobulbaceae bacterium]
MKPTLKYLSDPEIQVIHNSSLDILANIGIRFPHPEALERFAGAGATVEDDVVKIPAALVEKALETVPKRDELILYGRSKEHDISFNEHTPRLACMTMAVNVIDPFSGEKRLATDEDLAKLTTLADQLPGISVNGGLVTPQDVPGAYNDWYTWATTIKNTTKHITGGMLGKECVRDAVRMCALAMDCSEEKVLERPPISGWLLTLPPLTHDFESLDAAIEMAKLKVPIMLSSGPIMGVTSPVTIAGTIAQTNAEILAVIVLTQLFNPGAPLVYTSFARSSNMASGDISMSSPEFGILKVAMAQMGRSYDLPIRMPSMLRDTKVLDAQAGFETGMIGSVTAYGADLMDSMQLDMDLIVDFPDLVFCNECIGAIERLTRELVVDESTLALDAIEEVGIGGEFLSNTHTFKNFRANLWMPKIIERRNSEFWEQQGKLSVIDKATTIVRDMLNNPPAKLLSEEVEAAIDKIVLEAQAG